MPFMTKICDFPYSLQDIWPKNLIPYLWPDTLKYPVLDISYNNYSEAFNGLIDDDKKVASSKKYTQLKNRETIPYLIYDQNDWKTIPFGVPLTCFEKGCLERGNAYASMLTTAFEQPDPVGKPCRKSCIQPIKWVSTLGTRLESLDPAK